MPKDANKMMLNVPQDLENHGTWKKKNELQLTKSTLMEKLWWLIYMVYC